MRKLFAIPVLLLIALSGYTLFTYFEDEEITNFPSENSGIVAFGDSLVQGVGSTASGGFVKILSNGLGVEIKNLGVSGDTTVDALARISQVTELRPAITILLIGGNDYLRQIPREETIKNLKKIIERIHESGSAVILLGVESGRLGNRDNEIFESLAREYNTAYVPDVLGGIFGTEKYMSDGLHPNDDGYAIVAERVEPVLSRFLIRQ